MSMLRDAGRAVVPPHPLVQVEIDETGQVTVDGQREPHARLIDSRALAELAVLAVARDHATPLGRGVRVVASTPTEHSTMVVHPDGAVTELEAHEPSSPEGVAPATRAPHWLATREAERVATEQQVAGRLQRWAHRPRWATARPRRDHHRVVRRGIRMPAVRMPRPRLPHVSLPHVTLPHVTLPHVPLPHVELHRPDLRRPLFLAVAAGVAAALVVIAVAVTGGRGGTGSPSPTADDLRAAADRAPAVDAAEDAPPAAAVVGATRLARVAVADVGSRTAPGSLLLALESTRRTPVAILVRPVAAGTAPEPRRLSLSIRTATTREVTVDDLEPGRYRWTVRAPGQRRLTGYADVPAPPPPPTAVVPVVQQPTPVEQPPPSTAPPADQGGSGGGDPGGQGGSTPVPTEVPTGPSGPLDPGDGPSAPCDPDDGC